MPDGVSDFAAARARVNRNASMQNWARVGLMGLGVGAAARGSASLLQLLRNNSTRGALSRSATLGPTILSLPAPATDEDEEKEKRAQFLGTEDLVKAWTGDTRTPSGWMFHYPGAVGAGMLGLIGGYQGAGKLVDHRRKARLKSRLDKAKEEYEAVLSGQHKLAEDLTELRERLVEKKALLSASPEAVGKTLGMYMTAIGIPTAAAGYMSYSLARKNDRERILARARKERERQLWRQSPQPLLVLPEASE